MVLIIAILLAQGNCTRTPTGCATLCETTRPTSTTAGSIFLERILSSHFESTAETIEKQRDKTNKK